MHLCNEPGHLGSYTSVLLDYKAMELKINGKAVTVYAAPDTSLLWVIRDEPGLTGTRYGGGYCQSGQVMAATSLLRQTPHPTDAQIKEAMINLWRCITYHALYAARRDLAGPPLPVRWMLPWPQTLRLKLLYVAKAVLPDMEEGHVATGF